MPLFAGRVLLRHEAVEGWLEVEHGRAKTWGEGPAPERPDATGWIVPAPVNAHTHVADAFLRGVPGKPTTVPELVGPGGWKQSHLRMADPAKVRAGIATYTSEMAAMGTSAFVDFREGGVPGARLLRDLEPDLAARPIILGRPLRDAFDEAEAADLFKAADGLGLAALRDFEDPADAEAWMEAAHGKRKTVALHASEARREPVESILALEPDFLVHCTQATKKDLEAIGDADVSVVVCPRSNRFFGLRSPVQGLRAAGIKVAVGTDNGMLQDGNLLGELAQLRQWDPDLGLEEMLRWMTWNARDLAGLAPAWPPRRDVPLDLVVLPEDPLPVRRDTRPGFTGDVVPT